MLRKDYILRQFEEFGKVLALILGFKKNKDWDKFQKEIAEAAKKYTSLDIERIENLDDRDFEGQVIQTTDLTQEQKMILAALLFEKMNYHNLTDNRENFLKLKKRCLNLYQHIRDNFTENEFNLDVHYKLEFLNKMEG